MRGDVNADPLAIVLLTGALVVLFAVFGMRLAARLGVPGLLIFLALGLLLGTTLEPFDFENAQLAVVLGYSALVVILAEGGLTTRVDALRPVLWPSVALATLGIAVSIGVVGAVLHLVTGLDWRTALLMGAILAPTDAAAVFSVARRLRLPPRMRTLLEAEAGFNDAPVIVMISVLASADASKSPAWLLPILVVVELIGGAVIGVLVGWFARWAMPRLALPAAGLYPIAAVAFLVSAYAVAALLHTSGFLAVYVAGILLGSTTQLPHRRTVLGFTQALALTAEIGLFVMLGMLAETWRLPSAAFVALVAGVTLVLLARPAAALASLMIFRLPARWIAFVGVAGLRGAVPIVFAAIPLGAGSPNASLLFDATVIIVLLLTIIQTPILPWLARRLALVAESEAEELDVDVAPLEGMSADVLSFAVPPKSKLVGIFVDELGLPLGSVVALVVRKGVAIVPDEHTRIRNGDQLVIVVAENARELTEKRMRALSRSGRLATWFGDQGSL